MKLEFKATFDNGATVSGEMFDCKGIFLQCPNCKKSFLVTEETYLAGVQTRFNDHVKECPTIN